MIWRNNESLPLVSVVIPTHNRKDKLIRLIESILRSNYPKEKLEIIVVDDASTDGTYEEVKRKYRNLIHKGILKVIKNKSTKYSTYCRNIGVQNSKGKYIFVIDDDNIVDKSCIIELVKTLEQHDKVGMVCPLILWTKKRNLILAIGGRIPIIWKRMFLFNRFEKMRRKEINYVKLPNIIKDLDFCPNSFMIRKDLALKTLPESRIFPHNWSEVVWGLNVKKLGYDIVCNTKAVVWHDVNNPYRLITRMDNEFKAYDIAKSRIIFIWMYGDLLDKILLIITMPIFIFVYIILALKDRRSNAIKIIKHILRGTFDGISHIFTLSFYKGGEI